MKWRYLYISEDYELYGTNDSAVADDASGQGPVYDVVTGCYLGTEDPIQEWVGEDAGYYDEE